MILVGDIGGTKTTLAAFEPTQGLHDPVAEATFPSGKYASLEAIIQEFVAQHPLQVNAACFGVAGPVVGGQARITNLPWLVDENNLRSSLQTQAVALLNDLESVAYAVPALEPSDLYVLNTGRPVDGGSIAVLAPGTGLGEAYLTWDGHRYQAHASEGGHTDFGPLNEPEIGLLRYMMERVNHVSYEWVCSGMGIRNIYGYLRDSGYAPETPHVAEQLSQSEDHTPIIVRAGMDQQQPCPLCARTLEMFVSILGAETSNMALKVLATGGIYIGGGLPPRVLDIIKRGTFMEAFLNKGRFATLLSSMPIACILNPKAPLMGAAHHALTIASEQA